MDLAERFHHAQEWFHRDTKPYYEMLYRIESLRVHSYLFDPINNTLTKIEEPKTDYQIWIEKRIEEIKSNVFGHWLIQI